MATTDQIRSTVEAYAKAMTANDREAWLGLFAETATVEDPIGSDVRVGRESVGEFWDFVHSLTPQIDMEITGPLKVVEHEAAFGFTLTASVGDAKMRSQIIDVMTFDDDARIRTMRAYWTMADMQPVD
jgi:steroid delta-isomerase